MSSKEFSVSFQGPAVDQGVMDVADLAPSLLALGELFQSANRLLNGDRATVQLRVKAEPHSGSFVIDLEVFQSVAEQFKAMLLGDGALAAEKLFDLIIKGTTSVGLVATGLFGLIKFLKRKKPESTTTLSDGRISITINHETRIFAADVVKIYNDTRSRNLAAKVATPLRKDRIERLEFIESRKPVESIESADVPDFETIDEPEMPVAVAERETALEVVTATFDESRLWRMTDGSGTFNVGIEDQAFLQDVESRIVSFTNGDVLKVMLRSEQSLNPSGKLSTKHTVTRVIEKLEPPRQIPMFPRGGSN